MCLLHYVWKSAMLIIKIVDFFQGEHNSTYMVSSSENGLQFTKIRHGHPVEKATGSYAKVWIICAYVCVFSWIGSIWTHFQNKLTWRFMIYIIFCCLVASVFYFIMQTLHFHNYLGTIHSVLIDEDFTSPKMHNRSVRFLINIYNIYIFYFMRYKKIVFNFFSQEFNIIDISFCHSLSTSFYLKEE